MPTTNTVLRDSLYLTDYSDAAITGADLDDFTATASLLGSATTATVTITEESGGWYGTAFTPTVIGRWRLVVVYDDETVERTFTETYDVTAGEADLAASIATLLRQNTVSVASPIASTGTVTIQQGDDYLAADGRALEWTGTNWPDLTGAAVEWQLTVRGIETVYPATVVGDDTVRVELTDVQTQAMTPPVPRDYEVVATLLGGSIVTLADGVAYVLRNQT